MRRALLVAALAVPAVALAITAGSGQVLDTTNFNSTSGISYINAAQCAGTDALHLEWNIAALSGASFGQNDVFKIYASNTAPTTSNGGTFCAEKDDTTNGVLADQIGSLTPATVPVNDLDVAASTINPAAGVDCTSTSNETKNVFICAHWYDAAGTTKKGFATGTFQIQILKPNAPGGVNVQEGNTRLVVSWSANGTTPTRTDHYVARAFLPGGSTPVTQERSASTSATLSGLQNSTTYDVDVVAFSDGGNPSSPSARVQGTPTLTRDFWDTYRDRGGVEQGGCGSGPAGALALLGTALLLALRRRKP